MNKIIIIGNLTREPKFAETKNGTSVCTFCVAVNQIGGDAVDYFEVVAWKNLAELVNKYLYKGMKVCVEGQMNKREYTDSNGAKKSVWEINATSVEFLSTRKSAEGNSVVTDVGLPF